MRKKGESLLMLIVIINFVGLTNCFLFFLGSFEVVTHGFHGYESQVFGSMYELDDVHELSSSRLFDNGWSISPQIS